MPIIPTQDNSTVAPAGAPGVFHSVQASPEDFGARSAAAAGDLGRSLEVSADVAAKHALAFQGLQNETAAKDADAQLMNTLDRLVYDPKGGFATRFGREAVDGYGDAMQQANDAYRAARETLPNAQAQRLFDGSAQRSLQYALRTMSAHAAQQNKLWQVAASDGRTNTYQVSAMNSADGPERFNSVLATIRAETRAKGELLGWSLDQVNAEVNDQTGKARAMRIEHVIGDDPLRARQMLADEAEQIPPAARLVLEHRVRAAVRPIEARIVGNTALTGLNAEQLQAAFATSDTGLLKALDFASSTAADALPQKSRDTKAMLVDVIPRAEALARQLHPEDPQFAELAVNAAKGRIATIATAQTAREEQAYDTLLGIQREKPASSVAELTSRPGAMQAWVTLGERAKNSVQNVIESGNHEGRSQPGKLIELGGRIWADEGDANKITKPEQIVERWIQGEIGYGDKNRLLKELVDAQGGSVFGHAVQQARQDARRIFVAKSRADTGGFSTVAGEEAAIAFSRDLDEQIQRARDAGKDPRSLLTPGSPDFLMTPARMSTFMPKDLFGGAAARAGVTPPAAPVQLTGSKAEMDAQFAKLPSGSLYMGDDGKLRRKP